MTHVLTERIKQWAIERGLDKADPSKQILKLGEEYGELCEFVTKYKGIKVAKDAIGDMYIVLTILCLQLDLDIEDCIEMSYEEIRDRKGKLIDGVYVKEVDL